MAPSKPPVFAVCGGISVETVVTGAGRRRSSVKARRSETTGSLAESLYADLLWDCGGANVENEAAPGLPLPTETAPDEDFTDVFGGPPKFATLSFKRNMAKGSDTCFSGVSIFPSFMSAAPAINRTSVFNVSNGQPRLCSSQEAPGNPASLSNSAKSTKPRLTTEAEFSSRICYSDSDKKVLINPKEEAVFRGEELSTMVPQERTGVKASSTSMRRRESSRSDGGEDIKDSRGLKPSRKDFATMKENIQESSMGPGGDVEGQLASTHTRMASSSRGFQETSEKLACSAHNIQAEGRRHNLKIKKKGKSDDLWVTIKDIQFATEPSRFPPPSRPPPCPRLHSDAACIARDTSEAVKSVDDCPVRARQMSQKESFSDSGSLSSTYTQESYIKITSDSKDIKDAMEMAEAKIRMVLEAREKAKLMVEKKVREKQRARQHKARIATEGKLGKEHDCKEHMRDLGGEKNKSNARHCEEDVDKQDEEGLRKRDSARKCIERATREVRSKSAAVVQERAAEFRASHDISDRPVEDANEDGLANSAINSTPAESTPRWSDINVDLSKRLSHKAVPAKVVHEDDFFISREQQQDSLSSSWCYTERKRFCEAASLGKMGSMPRIREDLNLFPGGFQEIIGETDERRKARWDRHCQTAERMAKALEEKKLRDLERQKEQAERHRAGEMLDEEIKGWAAGKEGNLEALLCSLHYVLWPECGWVRVSPADLTSAAAVKKAYRRAALCVHPDKVQQKGATVAQKYIAEKIFDLLKEASAKSM